MSKKIARITQDKKLLLANEVVEDNAKTSLNSDGRLDTDEIIEYPAELEGGRNLLGNTAFNKPPETWSSNITVNKGEPNSVLVEKKDSSTFGIITKRNTKIIAGDVYTLSFELKTTNVSRLTYNYLMDNKEGNWPGIPKFDLITDGKWHFYSATFTSGVNRTNCGLMLAGDTRFVAGANSFEIRKIKLEKGSQATPWTPAPEDLGLNYPDSIQNFNSSISGNNIIAPEFIEGYPFVKPVIDDSLVLWLDGNTGNNYEKTNIWKDLSGNGNDGQLRNFNFTEDSGWVDGGLKFDGVDDYVQLPDLDLNPDNFTIQVDNKIRAFNGDKAITENGDEWGRNLLKQKPDGNYSNKYRDVIIQDGIMYWTQITGSTAPFTFYLYDTTLKTGDFVFSFKTNQIQELRSFIHVDGKTLRCSPVIVEHEDYYHVSMIFKNITISNSVYFYGTDPLEPPKEVQFWDFKLEKGSIATPWTPAPEDITETNIINHTTPFVENNTIHTLRLYNRALTDEEILQNYQAGQCSPLLAMRGDAIG